MASLYLDDPRLNMNPFSRGAARLVISLSYAFFAVLAPTLLVTDIPALQWSGALLALFVLDAFIHLGKAEDNIPRTIKSADRLNIARYLSVKSLTTLLRALDKSLLAQTPFAVELLKNLSSDPLIREGLARLDADIHDFLKLLDRVSAEKNAAENGRETLTRIAQNAFLIAHESGESAVEPSDLFVAAAMEKDPAVSRLFGFFSIDPADIQNAMLLARLHKKISRFWGSWFAPHPRRVEHRIMNRAWTSRPTPLLDRYSLDFTDQARLTGAGSCFLHETEYQDLVSILSRPTKPNALLIGDPGSGKETIVYHLAQEIVADNVPKELFDKRLVVLHLGSLVGGATAEEVGLRVNKIAAEILGAGNIILFIPDIHNLLKTSGEKAFSAADVFIPIIQNNAFPVIGGTFPREWKEFIEPQTDFAAAFEPIRVAEMSEADAVRALTYESIPLEIRYKTVVSFGAVKTAVTVAHKYFRHKLLPASAAELLKEALADATQKNEKAVGPNDIIAIAERKTNVPIHRPGRAETEKLLHLEEIIHQRLIDQEEAVTEVARALREYRSGLARQGGPIASFLFVGPTGVGKTELAKTLAEIQFGSETLMVRFDMSEYQDKQSFFRFIGSPDGKIAGMLTEAVIQKPYCLILLDEFEKSHPDILNLFLQVLDDGRLTDNLGRTIDFTNTILIATSNANSEFIKSHLDAHTPITTIAEELKKKLTDFFKPELLNRFSGITVFKTLSPEDLRAVAQLQLQDLVQSLEEAQGVKLTYENAVLARVAELGFDPSFGARPLRQVIADKLRAPLAEKLLKGDIVHGDAVKIALAGSEFQFQIKTDKPTS